MEVSRLVFQVTGRNLAGQGPETLTVTTSRDLTVLAEPKMARGGHSPVKAYQGKPS